MSWKNVRGKQDKVVPTLQKYKTQPKLKFIFLLVGRFPKPF